MKNKQDFPKTLPGFESINRYWDFRLQAIAAKILPGEYYVTLGGELVATVLGSCVSACIRDPIKGVGGINHFLLPPGKDKIYTADSQLSDRACRYGNHAMKHLISEILKQGGRRENLEVKIFGGARIINCLTDVGGSNIRFVRRYLSDENLKIVAEDVGGTQPRKIIFFPDTGKVMLKKFKELHNNTIIDRESAYMKSFKDGTKAGNIDIFN